MPLFIFEPRYRKMLKDVLAADRIFAIAMARQDSDPEKSPIPCDVAGVGLVRVCVDNDDGTSNLILQGIARVRLTKAIRQRPYPKALIEPIPSTNQTGLEVDALMVKVAECAIAKARQIPQMPEQISRFLSNLTDPDILSDIVGYTLIQDPIQKQHLLETADVRQRLHDLIPMLK